MTINDGLYFATATISLICLVYRGYRRYRTTDARKVLTFIFLNLFLTGFFEVLKDWYISEGFSLASEVRTIETIIYFALHNLLSPCFAYYIVLINGAAKNKGRDYTVWFFTPMAIAQIVLAVTPATNFAYGYDEQGNYYRGPGMIVFYLVALFYFVYLVYSLHKTKNVLKSDYIKGYPIFLGTVVVGIIITLISADFQLEPVTEAVAAVGLMLTIDCNDGLIDIKTGWPNKAWLKMNVRLYDVYKYNYTFITVRFLNLNNYKDSMASSVRNNIVNKLSDLIENAAPDCEIYRYDESTFTVVVSEQLDEEKISEDIINSFGKAIHSDISDIDIRTVISIAKVPEDIESWESHERLIEYVPESANSQLTVLESHDLTFIKRENEIKEALHRAIVNQGFDVFYQPIWERSSGKIVACEALCRLYDSELGSVPPGEFIKIAEKNGMIVDLGYIVFEKVCRAISAHKLWNLGIKKVEINLSPFQLLARGLADRLEKILYKYSVPVNMINFEITETAPNDSRKDFTDVISKLTSMGFKLSLDDYGTAYSNISNVMSNNYSNIKIDASILWEAEKDRSTKELLRSTIQTLKNAGNNIVQEGVETEKQLIFVTDAGANLVQGYYFSKPLPIEEFVRFVKDFNTKNDIKVNHKEEVDAGKDGGISNKVEEKEEAGKAKAIAEKAKAAAEKDKVATEKDKSAAEKDKAAAEKAKAAAEKDKAAAEKDKAAAEKDKAVSEKDKAEKKEEANKPANNNYNAKKHGKKKK